MFGRWRFSCLALMLVFGGIVPAQERRVERPAALGATTYRGDANGNGLVEPTDIFFIINYLIGGGAAPARICLADADSNQGRQRICCWHQS